MIIDVRKYPGDPALRCDVCIVGAGPAGIVVARELAKAGKDVILLESGGLTFEKRAHDLNRGEVADAHTHSPLEDYRRRRLGGATTSWGGRCVPFDTIDYEPRPFVPESGWPFDKAHIDPYHTRACAYLELGDDAFRVRDALPPPARDREMVPGLHSDEIDTDSLYLFSPPTDFAAAHRRELDASERVRLYLHANCLKIVRDCESRSVESIEAGEAGGPRLTVHARQFVLAAGGLEVTRLLLASGDLLPRGADDSLDLVGRYYMCHIVHHLEVEFASADVIWDYEKTRAGAYCQRTISVTEQGQRALGLLNHRARIEHPPIADPAHRNGVLSTAYLVKRMLSNRLLANRIRPMLGTLSRGVVEVRDAGGTEPARPSVVAHARNLVTDLPQVVRFSNRWLRERILSERKLPSMVLRNQANLYTLRIDAEQCPNPNSRVTLGEERDALGQRRLKVDWRHTEADVRNLARTSEIIGRALESSGAGKVRPGAPVDPQATGGHHIGTTRMGTSASRGVVDENCRVHGLDNLYIASSSVFPTCSYANPTLMVLSLAIRLSDHLAGGRV